MSAPDIGIGQALQLLHPSCNRERLTIVLRAYLDASGKWQSKDKIIVIAGLAVGEANYGVLESLWNQFLQKNGLTGFHSTRFWARERPYTEWSDEQHRQAQESIISMLAECKPFGFAVGVDCSVYADWQIRGSFPFYHEDAYYFCLDRCLQILIRGLFELGKDEGILIYCDQESEHEALGAQLARWHTNRVRQGMHGHHIDPNRIVEITYGSNFLRTLLMIADIYANGIFRVESGSAKQEQRDFMERMAREANLTSIIFRTLDHIEIDMKHRAKPY
jgi:hypothetical protein